MYVGEDFCTCLHISVRASGKICTYFINYGREEMKARNGLKHVEQEKICLP